MVSGAGAGAAAWCVVFAEVARLRAMVHLALMNMNELTVRQEMPIIHVLMVFANTRVEW
jgi:hypothetical protein